MDRRAFLKSLGALPAFSLLYPNIARTSDFGNTHYNITAQSTQWHLFSQDKPATKIWSFESKSFGQPIYAKQNETLKVKVSNDLKQGLGVHWHGIRLNNDMDGVPHLTQKPIASNNGFFEYTFASPDAGTYWYHAHSNSSEQVEKGLLGPLIVRERTPYPVDDDITFLIKDWRIDKNFQIVNSFNNRHDMSHNGRWGNLITVNGKYLPTYSCKTNSRLRFRFINGSNARILALDLSAFEQAILIAIDGHPVQPRKYQPMYLAPGMRMDVVVDVNSSKRTYPVHDNAGEQAVPLMSIYTEAKKSRQKALPTLPQPLPENPLPLPKLNQAKVIDINFDGGAMSMGMMSGMMSGLFWKINGKSMREGHEHNTPMLSLRKNKSYIFNIKNNTRFAHPMHIHGHTFKVLQETPYWSDTIFLLPEQNIKVAFVADNPGLWMFHCHILEHQISGMMGVIEVA